MPDFIYITFILLFTATVSQAQVVNIEKKRVGSKVGLQGDIDFSLSFNKNVTEIFQSKNSVKLQYYHKQHLFLFLNDYSFIRADNKNYVNDGFQHFRYNYNFKKLERLTYELFTQHQFNSIRKVQRRYLIGTGPRIAIADTGNFRLYLGPLFIYENEKIIDDTMRSEKIRMSAYISAQYAINESLSFSFVTYYQPHLSHFANYRLTTETFLKIRLINRLAVKLIFETIYDTRPPATIPGMMYALNTGLNYAF